MDRTRKKTKKKLRALLRKDNLKYAVVLKEILDAPRSERMFAGQGR
ncbi:MAG: hypothetical protein GF333_00745 [Candidatus Omnitrophica bacterium]|nr:hypothetical protein [Candidatus Omnitrophota bacterium]